MTKLDHIKTACRRVIELGEQATPGPWITGSIPWKVWADGGYKTICDVRSAGDEVPVAPGLAISESMAGNRDFIAHARTFSPSAAQALLTAIEALEAISWVDDDRAFPQRLKAHAALQQITDQWP